MYPAKRRGETHEDDDLGDTGIAGDQPDAGAGYGLGIQRVTAGAGHRISAVLDASGRAHPADTRSARPFRSPLYRCRAHGLGDGLIRAHQLSATLSGVAGERAERSIDTAA